MKTAGISAVQKNTDKELAIAAQVMAALLTSANYDKNQYTALARQALDAARALITEWSRV